MTPGWKINTILTIFNVMDTLGRNVPNCVKISQGATALTTFIRVIFIFTTPLIIALERTYLVNVNNSAKSF